jgi:hypothetical protein
MEFIKYKRIPTRNLALRAITNVVPQSPLCEDPDKTGYCETTTK